MVASNAETKIQPPADTKRAATDDEKAAAQAAAQAAADASPHKGKFVLYTGPGKIAVAAEELKARSPKLGEGTHAEITKAQWEQAGVKSERSHVWSLANNWRIPASQFTHEQLDYLLTYSRRFELVNDKGEKVTAD